MKIRVKGYCLREWKYRNGWRGRIHVSVNLGGFNEEAKEFVVDKLKDAFEEYDHWFWPDIKGYVVNVVFERSVAEREEVEKFNVDEFVEKVVATVQEVLREYKEEAIDRTEEFEKEFIGWGDENE